MTDPLADPHRAHTAATRTTATVPELLRGVVASLLVATLLGSGALVELAERQPFGWQRDLLVGAAGSVDRLANALSLNRPVDWALDLKRDGTSAEAENLLAALDDRPAPEPEEVRPPLRTISRSAPLELYVGGDSMVRELGAGIKSAVADAPVTSETDFKVISGLTRPDFLDWPARLATLVDEGRPEAMVLMFGANDFQGIKTADGQVFPEGSPGWIEEYRSRVALVMDLLDQPGTTLHWVGLPVMRSDSFSADVRVMNEIYRTEADKRSWVTYVSTYELFADEDGGYAAFLDLGSGLEPMRQDDGVHWSSPGAVRAGEHVFAEVAATWGLAP